MKSISKDIIDQLVNAIQLSIQSPIDGWTDDGNDSFSINFSYLEKNDRGLELLQKLNLGGWNEKRTSYKIRNLSKTDIHLLTAFLMLSRLNKDNVLKLVEMENKYRALASQMGLQSFIQEKETISNLSEAIDKIFGIAKSKGITLRKLSEETGLSQTALSNFKAGKDIRLSNFLKIAKSLGLLIKIAQQK